MEERVREMRRVEREEGCGWESEESGDSEEEEMEMEMDEEGEGDAEREGWWRDRERLERGEVDRNGDRVKRRRVGDVTRRELVGR